MKKRLSLTARLIFLICAVNIVLAPFGCGAYASGPYVEHEYISKYIGGEESREEKISVDYKGLSLNAGDSLRIVFYDIDDEILDECEIILSADTPIDSEVVFAPEAIRETKHIHLELIASGSVASAVNLSLGD